MQTNDLTAVKGLIDTGFEAVGCRMPVEIDGEGLFVRDLVVEKNKDLFLCFEASNPDKAIFAMPSDAPDAVAAAVVIHVLKGIVARAVQKG